MTGEKEETMKLLEQAERDEYLTRRVHPEWFGAGLSWDEIPTQKFSTWEGFGKLWEWSQKQEWWETDVRWANGAVSQHIIHPDRFANAVYEFLKEREK